MIYVLGIPHSVVDFSLTILFRYESHYIKATYSYATGLKLGIRNNK